MLGLKTKKWVFVYEIVWGKIERCDHRHSIKFSTDKSFQFTEPETNDLYLHRQFCLLVWRL